MTAKEIADKLEVDERKIRKSKGTFRYHVSYFYGFATPADKLVNRVKEKIPQAVIVDQGNHWHEFVGGAASGSAKDSYLWVKFTV